ncbi:MAG: hypothetical protein VYD64_05675, partial [Pseudomonadota bacterium]|nr:hypothetical protein [Pseudomonadota bacterium]
MLARLFRLVKWLSVALLVLVLALLAPVAWVETVCRDQPVGEPHTPLMAEARFHRAEANSYLTYPEWHIVYAYEGLANVLKTDDEHAFDYLGSVAGFWSSFCKLNRTAQRHGGGDGATRVTIHTIGVSFTLEMLAKAAYEETLGRLFAALRGPQKTPQDDYARRVAANYADFLQQIPWYKYDFDTAARRLWLFPVIDPLRGWERRLALGAEWKVKAVYAKVIANAVSATTGPAQLRLRSVVTDIDAAGLSQVDGVEIVGEAGQGILIETPRYRAFRTIARGIADAGGEF